MAGRGAGLVGVAAGVIARYLRSGTFVGAGTFQGKRGGDGKIEVAKEQGEDEGDSEGGVSEGHCAGCSSGWFEIEVCVLCD